MSNGFQLIEGQVIGNDSVAAPAVGDIPIARFDQPVVLLAELKDGFEKLVVGLFKCAEDGEFLGDAVSCLHEGAVGGDDDAVGSQDKGGRAWQFLNEFGEGSEHFLIIVIFCFTRKAVMGIEIEVAFGGKLLKCGCWGDGDAADIAGECTDGEGCDVLKALSLKEVEGEPGHFTGIAEDGADISAGGKVS